MEKEILDSYINAGKIAAQALNYGKTLIKVDAKVVDVCDKVEEKIRSLGGSIAFPAQISINNIAAHFCPVQDDPLVFKEGDLAKLDLGVHINGFVADTATSVNLGDHDNLIKASREALNNALKIIDIGVTLAEIGKTIHETITSYGFSPIKNLSGHGLGKFIIHQKPTIPNFDTGDTTKITEDLVFAVEPFATNGHGSVFESSPATIFSLINKKPVRSPYARALLKDIDQFNELPFTTRWLSRNHGFGKTGFGLKELVRFDVIKEFPPLPEKDDGIVSQAEHSLLFHKDKKIIFTNPD